MDSGPDLPKNDSASAPGDDAAEPKAAPLPPSKAAENGAVGIDGAPLPEGVEPTLPDRLKTLLIGKPHNLEDKSIFKHISLVAFLAWVGLGADGLSSTAYGPAEAFENLSNPVLGDHRFLAIFLAIAIAATVFIITACYSHIIEAFPSGGGGYLVASKLLGRQLGAVAGSALLVGYVLTIAVSIAAAGDALFGLVGLFESDWKLYAESAAIVALIVLNLRGVKESIQVLLPIFLLFLLTHFVLIVGALGWNVSEAGTLAENIAHEVTTSYNDPQIGLWGMFTMLMMAYSLGAATYTGIEAVSNSTQVMREPRVATAQRTMRYMAWSLALAAGGLIVSYLLLDLDIRLSKTETLNLALTREFMAEIGLHDNWLGSTFTWATMLSEGALLLVAAQVGYIGGPRLLASMAQDSWMPRWFSNLSERLATQNGILLMGTAALAALLATGGELFTLVVMYVINVFVTFSLSMLGMCRHWYALRGKHPLWRRRLALFVVGAVLCWVILVTTICQKFFLGGWRTMVVTGACVALCFLIHRYYYRVGKSLRKLNDTLGQIPTTGKPNTAQPDPAEPAAVILVGDYSGLGIHTMLNAVRFAPDHFKSFVFVSVGVIDTGNYKGSDAVDSLRAHCEDALRRYVDLGQKLGMASTSVLSVDTDAVDGLEECCLEVAKKFPKVTFFAGQLVFQKDTWLHRLLHNQTAFSLQRRLQWAGVPMVILPTRVR